MIMVLKEWVYFDCIIQTIFTYLFNSMGYVNFQTMVVEQSNNLYIILVFRCIILYFDMYCIVILHPNMLYYILIIICTCTYYMQCS